MFQTTNQLSKNSAPMAKRDRAEFSVTAARVLRTGHGGYGQLQAYGTPESSSYEQPSGQAVGFKLN
jgi:hypothetical protein